MFAQSFTLPRYRLNKVYSLRLYKTSRIEWKNNLPAPMLQPSSQLLVPVLHTSTHCRSIKPYTRNAALLTLKEFFPLWKDAVAEKKNLQKFSNKDGNFNKNSLKFVFYPIDIYGLMMNKASDS